MRKPSPSMKTISKKSAASAPKSISLTITAISAGLPSALAIFPPRWCRIARRSTSARRPPPPIPTISGRPLLSPAAPDGSEVFCAAWAISRRRFNTLSGRSFSGRRWRIVPVQPGTPPANSPTLTKNWPRLTSPSKTSREPPPNTSRPPRSMLPSATAESCPTRSSPTSIYGRRKRKNAANPPASRRVSGLSRRSRSSRENMGTAYSVPRRPRISRKQAALLRRWTERAVPMFSPRPQTASGNPA